MDKKKLSELFQEKGWKIKQDTHYLEYPFDIIGERSFILTNWYLLITFTDKLTKNNIPTFQNNFADISNKSKSWIWGKCFLYCVIANSTDPEITDSLKDDSFGLWGVFRLKGGGGKLFLADVSESKVYGKVPTLPYDIHKRSKELVEILQKVMKS